MKTRRKKTEDQPDLPGTRIDNPEAPDETATPAARPAKVTFAFDTNPDGTIDFSKLRESTKDRLRVFMTDPGFQREFAPPQAHPMPDIVPAPLVQSMWSAVGSLEVMLAHMANVPNTIAQKVFPYTPAELQMLTPPTLAVINKHASDWMLKWKEEITLVGVFGSITLTKVNLCMMLMKQQGALNVVEMPKPEEPDTEKVQ